MQQHDVLIAIVVFEPDRCKLDRVLDAATSQSARVLVLRNDATRLDHYKTIEVLSAGANMGLAAAYNAALSYCLAHGIPFLLLLDQDTELAEGYSSALAKMLRGNDDLAAIGGRPMDRRVSQQESKQEEQRWGLNGLVQTSGTMLRVAPAIDAGGFDQSLFIHHVDQEFFLRLIDKGWSLGTSDLYLDHEPGAAVWGGWPTVLFKRSVRKHSSFRMFYAARNSVALTTRSYLPASWRAFQIAKMLGLLVGQSAFGFAHLYRAGRGFLRGLFAGLSLAGSRTPQSALNFNAEDSIYVPLPIDKACSSWEN